jgi:hypothetical protein
MMVNSLETIFRLPDVSAEEALAIPLVLLNSTNALRPQNSPPPHRVRICKKVAHIGRAGCGRRLPPKRDFIEVHQLGPGMRKTSLYGEQREAAIVLLAAKSLLRGCEQDLAIASDGCSRIVGSVVDSKREHSLYPSLLSAAFSAVATAADQKSRRPLLALEPPEDMRSTTALIYRP